MSDDAPHLDEFRMPSLGADMQFGTVVAWCVKPGDRVKRGDIVAEIETEKGVFDTEIGVSGVIEELRVPVKTRAPVGAVLALITTDGASPALGVPAATPVPPAAGTVPAAMPPPLTPASRVAREPGAKRSSPAARRLAHEHGIDVGAIAGSGPDGAVVAADVEQAIAARAATPPAHPARVSPLARHIAEAEGLDLGAATGTGPRGIVTKSDVERLRKPAPMTGEASAEQRAAAMRQAVAAAVTRSKREIPHYYLGTDIDLEKALAWLEGENAQRPVIERVLPAVLLLKSVAVAVRQFPLLNGFWVDGAFRASAAVHIGVAISLRGGGLIAPAIHDADSLTIAEWMRALSDLVRRARTGGLRSSEMTDATITVSNLGDEGVTSVYGVIYPPQVALVGFGKITERPWAVNGLLGVHRLVTATLAADHRATDGHYGAQFLNEVDRLLQQPEAL